jgi:chitosanase
MSNYKSIIKKVLLAFEQSSTSIQYNKVYLWNDGPKNCKQVTLSFGATEYGNLKELVRTYCNKGGRFADALSKFVGDIGIKPLADNKEFIDLLKQAGTDPMMHMVQDQAFEDMYIMPAMRWCDKSKLELPLSRLVVADSYLQSGSILMSLRNKFPEKLPSLGGNEKKWIESYCIVRRDWLATHTRKILNNTVYRMDFMQDLIEKNDWNLDKGNYVANGVKITPI